MKVEMHVLHVLKVLVDDLWLSNWWPVMVWATNWLAWHGNRFSICAIAFHAGELWDLVIIQLWIVYNSLYNDYVTYMQCLWGSSLVWTAWRLFRWPPHTINKLTTQSVHYLRQHDRHEGWRLYTTTEVPKGMKCASAHFYITSVLKVPSSVVLLQLFKTNVYWIDVCG